MARTNELDRALTEITRRLDVLETCEKLLLAGTNVKAALATAREAKKLLLDHRDKMDLLAKRLIEKETIERDEFETILVANGVTPKKKLDIEHQV